MSETKPETPRERYMRAYYNTFAPTGCDAVDAVLEAIAIAGKAYHGTAHWSEPVDDGSDVCFWDRIQTTANEAASALTAALAAKEAAEQRAEALDTVLLTIMEECGIKDVPYGDLPGELKERLARIPSGEGR